MFVKQGKVENDIVALLFSLFLYSELGEGKVHDPKEYYKERIEVSEK